MAANIIQVCTEYDQRLRTMPYVPRFSYGRGPLHTKASVAYPGIFFGGGVQQIQLRTEDREDGDLGAVAP